MIIKNNEKKSWMFKKSEDTSRFDKRCYNGRGHHEGTEH